MPSPLSEHSLAGLVDKLILLEQQAGTQANYRIMSLPTIQSHSVLSLQRTAKEIAAFAGLTDLTFIVATSRQDEGVGATIDLSTQDSAVFIEIKPELKGFPDAADATLCHEISHKWLQRTGIRSPVGTVRDNEILTDVAGVYLGFGKIMLNGYRVSRTRTEYEPDKVITRTETQTCGYLDRDELALVYCLVNAMRRIPDSESLSGLNAVARGAVDACMAVFGSQLTPRRHDAGEAGEAAIASAQAVKTAQLTMSTLDKHVAYVEKGFCEVVSCALRSQYRHLDDFQREIADQTRATHNPALRFLRTIKAEHLSTQLSEEAYKVTEIAEKMILHSGTIGHYLSHNAGCFPPPTGSMFNTIVCPRDGTKLKLPEDSGNLLVNCPVCNYRFAYNTAPPTFEQHTSPRRRSWLQKLLRLMKRPRR